MRTKVYCLFIFLAFLSINGNARTDGAPTLWKDLGEITKPMVVHETYNTSYAANRYGSSKNDIFFTFVVRRTTVFTSNFNGSPLEDVSAHLLYSSLDEDKYTNVGESIPVDYEKFTEKTKLLRGWNLSLEEKIHHGWIGTLYIQILKPGKYILHCEAGQYCDNGYIRSNIYINPVGTSKEEPKVIGVYDENFDYDYSAIFAEQPSGIFYAQLHLNRTMNVHISSKGTKKGSALAMQVKENSSGRIMSDSKYFPKEDGTYPQIGNVRLNAGMYTIEIAYTGKTELYMNVTGELSGYLPGDLRENSIVIPTVSNETDYQKTFDTRDYTDQYKGKPTKDIYHRLEVKDVMDLLITCPRCDIEGGATITVMNGSGSKKGVLDTNTSDELELPGLQAGTYYIISEGNINDGSMTLRVQGNPQYRYGPSIEKNYIKTIVPTISASTPTLLNNPYKAQQQIDYYDFLGRPEQTVNYGASLYLNDLNSYTEYDGLGRKSRSWLPTISPISGAYANPQDLKFYSSIYYRDSCVYEKSIYEASPLNRIIESYGPGKEWQLSGHSVKSGYRCNIVADSCKYFVVEGAHSTPALRLLGAYPENLLGVTITEDEDGHIGYSFTDIKGHVVLERQVVEDAMLDTYYVYDDYGNLCFVLPPVAADSFVETGEMTDTLQVVLDKYGYQYIYDYRNRCVVKKYPGCEPVEQIYDCNDRLPFTQDGEQRKRNEWNVTLTDLLGRTVITGIYKGEIDKDDCASINVATLFSPGDADAYYGYLTNLPDEFILDSLEISQVNFYDTYEMMEGISELNYQEDENFGKRYVNTQTPQHCKGLLTGSLTRILDSEDALFCAYYYDFHRNRIQERTISTITGKDLTVKASFNFSGNPTATCEEYDGGKVKLQKGYVYTPMGKVQEEVHTLNGQDSIRFVYEYNLSGSIAAIVRIKGNESLRTSNTYNIRNWLTRITTPEFHETLHYTDGVGAPCYNGNISSMTWRTDTVSRGYTFSYDRLSRLKNATYGEGTSLSDNLNRFDEQITGYDKLGNILGIKRYGQTNSSTYGLIDDLSLSYDGNQLQTVNDNSINSVYADGFEFKDGAKQDVEYFYDDNGNLIKDLNKKITDIQYNYLNLPTRILFEGGNSVSYLYDANGTKLRTTHVVDGDTLTTDNWGSAIYENGVLTKLLTTQGYFTLSDAIYHYFLQDHQGNNRVVVDQNGVVEEVNHYYPFGGVFNSTSSVQPYKYNGKELDRRNGLDWYDYGARHYDAALGRWNAVDPMAKEYYWESPYGYCGNSPINWVDPDGRMKVIYNPDGTYKETTHNNWFHNTFIGRKEYIDYGSRKVNLSESEFWQWQKTGKYENINSVTSIFSNLELTLNEHPVGFADGVAKYIGTVGYSTINSPKVWLTGQSWAGTYATPDERASGFIDVATQYFPLNRLLKQLKPVSWYKFKNENLHIPVKNKHAVYDMEMRKFNGRNHKPKTFEHLNNGIDGISFINENKDEQ